MKTVLMQRVSENAKRVETNYVIWILSVASVILFILTIDTLTITELEPYGFYYFRTLPAYFWAGVATTLAAIIISVAYDPRRKNDYRLVPVLLLGLIIYGTPVFTYEIPRFTDIFAHGAESLPIITGGEVDQNDRYAREYPSSFILLGISAVVQEADPMTIIRYTELFTSLAVLSLVYCIARTSNSRYAVIAPVAFMGAFWVDQGHFSPQGLALIFYLTFFLALIKAIVTPSNRRGWLAVAMIMLIAVNFTSPTNSLFLILNLATITIASFLVYRKRNVISNRVIVFIALAGALFLSWSIYNAETRTIFKAEEFENLLADDFFTQNIKVTPSPSESYAVVNTLRTAVVGLVLASGAVMSIMLLRKQKTHQAAIMVGWFATGAFIVISMYLSPVLLSRNFMFICVPWAVVATLFMTHGPVGEKRNKIARIAVVAIVIALVVSIPATRYGRDPTTYASSSIVNSSAELADSSVGGEKVISYFMGSLVTKYFAAANGLQMDTIAFDKIFQNSYLNNKPDAPSEWLDSQSVLNSRVFFSDPERNNIAMKYDEPELYENLEETIEEDHNLVINSGSTRVYSSTLASETLPEEEPALEGEVQQ
ncbi:MAG TPA: hypothetical protein VJL54_01005 [Nitrososphaera sp.]|nr:hypothetical protein [Nitrososphaera sp.]